MPKPSTTPDTRNHILNVGEQLVRSKGFTALGLAELLGCAGVPKGSFYHYFASKEAFGAALIERHFARYHADLAHQLSDCTLGDGRARLLAYFGGWIAQAECDAQFHTCLAVKLAAEVADDSEAMRDALDVAMQGIIRLLAQAITTAQADGSLAPHLEAAPLAASLYAGWLGAALLAKVSRSGAPLKQQLAETEARLPPPPFPVPSPFSKETP